MKTKRRFLSRVGMVFVQILWLLTSIQHSNAAAPLTVVAWGSNDYGQTNAPIAAKTGVIAIAAGYQHTLAVKSDGTVMAWGATSGINVPSDLTGVVAVAGGGAFSVALKSDGTVVAWGQIYSGSGYVPIIVPPDLSGITAVSAGYHHAMALKNNGAVVAWGYNGDGQTNVPVAAQSGVVAIAAGYFFSVALKADGTVIAWGNDGQGQATVPPGLNGVRAVAAGGEHTVALKNAGLTHQNSSGRFEQAEEVVGLEGSVELFALGPAFAGLVAAQEVERQPAQQA